MVQVVARELTEQKASRNLLIEAYDETLEGWSRALERRDHETEGHSKRVTTLAVHLAMAMHMSEEDIVNVRRGALLHDIGKIGIPDAVLQKPGRLTAEEYGLIKLQPQLGRRILENVGRFDSLLAGVELHHEKHDGTGNPFGLGGENVPRSPPSVHILRTPA